MVSFELQPRYSTNLIPGKCIKCLGEEELNSCLLDLLRVEGKDRELEQRFEALVSFLKSPESRKLRDESERLLSEGKRVTLKIEFEESTGKPKYELHVE